MSDDLDKTRRDLNQVLAISRAMVAASDLDELLNLIIERSMGLLDAERASLFLYDAERNELVSRIAAGVEEIRVPADRGISGATVATGQTINVPDAYADSRFNPDVDRHTGYRTRNILSVPLKAYDGALVGVLQVINKRRGAFEDYDVSLAETLAAQAGVAIQRARLIEHYIEKQEMERAMQIAREIQQDLLPDAAPDIEGFDVAGLARPADATGGDSYDFFPLPDGQWMLAVADATGHGIGPALVVAETRAMLRAIASHSRDVAAVLRIANELLMRDLDGSRFVTCFLGLLDPAAGRLLYASAGHGPLVFYTRADDAFRQAGATDLPLGVLADSAYEQTETVEMAPGDLAIIPTDGFMEACNPAGEQFGVERMTDLIRRERDEPPATILDDLHAAVRRFAAGAEQADDCTAILVRRT